MFVHYADEMLIPSVFVHYAVETLIPSVFVHFAVDQKVTNPVNADYLKCNSG